MSSSKNISRIIQTYSPYNLGDHVYNFFLFYHINHILISENIWIEYRCPHEYHVQLSEFIPQPARVSILDYNGKMDDIGVRMHIGSPFLPVNIETRSHTNFDGFYLEYYRMILDAFKLPENIAAKCLTPPPCFQYNDLDLLLRYENLPADCKDIDILVINSKPRSGQYLAYFSHKNYWDNYLVYLAYEKKLNIITTEKIVTPPHLNVKCTMDYNLNLKNIGALSTRAKVIIAVNTGPLSPCYNTYTLEYVRRIYMFHDIHTHITPKVVKKDALHEINPDELVSICR